MAASSHNPFPRSPNPSTRSYDSSSVSSATSPRPQVQLLGNLMGSSSRPNTAQAPQPIGIPPLPPVSQTGFQPYTPVTATSVMGRDSLPPTDSVASTPGLSSAQLSANVSAQKRAYRQRRKDPRYVLEKFWCLFRPFQRANCVIVSSPVTFLTPARSPSRKELDADFWVRGFRGDRR